MHPRARLTPLSIEPHYGEARNQSMSRTTASWIDVKSWTHYDDLRNYYGVDENGQRVRCTNNSCPDIRPARNDGNITLQNPSNSNSQMSVVESIQEYVVQRGCPLLETLRTLSLTSSKFDP